MKNKILSGVIGLGVGEKHLIALKNNKNSIVKYACDFNKKKINFLKSKYPKIKFIKNENKIFRDKFINLVSIASYDNYHFKQVLKAIKYKKNIIIEKPICLSENELKKIKTQLRKNPEVKITSNLVLRTLDVFKNLKKKITNKSIRNPYYIEADYLWGRKYKLFGWRSKINNYSLVHGAAIHMIDLIMWLINDRPIKVTTYGNKIITKNSAFKKNSFVILILEFSNGIIVKITANGVCVYPHFHELKIYSKNKTIIHSYKKSFELNDHKSVQKKLDGKYPDKKNRKEIIDSFVNALKNKKAESIVTKKDVLDVMSVCIAAEKSLKLSKSIKIKY